jgi:hypothetical protein
MAATATPMPIPAFAPVDNDDPLLAGGETDGEVVAGLEEDIAGVEAVDVWSVDVELVGAAENVTSLSPASLINCHVTEFPIAELTKKKWQKIRSASFALLAGLVNWYARGGAASFAMMVDVYTGQA